MRDGSPHQPKPRSPMPYRNRSGETTERYPLNRYRQHPPRERLWDDLPRRAPRRLPRWAVLATRFGVATLLAILMPIVLAQLGLARAINDGMSAAGFDNDRVLLLEYALVAFCGALAAGTLLQWSPPTWLGSLVYYIASYLLPFIGQAQHPPLAPDGASQMLVPDSFAVTIATLLAAGLILSGAGAVLGSACGRIFAAPFMSIGRVMLARMGMRRPFQLSRRWFYAIVSTALLSAVLIAALALVAGNIDSILNYGPVATIYQSERLPAVDGTVSSGLYPSPALGGILRQYMIYLPPSYASSLELRYPVIYMLHGNPGNLVNWFKGAHVDVSTNALISMGKIRGVILVSPDGNGPIYRSSQWANSINKRQLMENSIVNDLVPYIDSHYRTLANSAHRTIVGLSDGGYGAVNIALHHPTIFGTTISLSGFFHATTSPVFGTGPTSDAYRAYNSPASYVMTRNGLKSGHALNFIICAGTNDHTFYPLATAFYKELRLFGLHVTFLQGPGGHSWPLWASLFARILPLVEPPSTIVAAGNSLAR